MSVASNDVRTKGNDRRRRFCEGWRLFGIGPIKEGDGEDGHCTGWGPKSDEESLPSFLSGIGTGLLPDRDFFLK
ncbi:hypothetical protein TRIP_B200581 [uncultured Desulfatiglans sp.]|nr:hypothetical protein TRIP_B200581 [uncultured Desulfatiglans sp.]